ncbi:MAG TPA: ABC transporter substrate-binding protein [Acetobacteraceae bacterium]|nr:ABC transporter substrate-binding protein [Acetobacteraceae bacterium]
MSEAAARMIGRRATLLLPLTLCAVRARAAAPTIRIGVLRFGTVSWEIDVIRRHGLDAAAGVAVEPIEYAAAQATQTALQAGVVDMVVIDWLWVSRQRHAGADFTFTPFSNASGGLIAPPDSPVRAIGDLPGRRLGVAGSPIDKNWLILRAYAEQMLGVDIARAAQASFAPPPLLHEQIQRGRLDAVLTFWPFVAKGEAAGMRHVLDIGDAVRGLGIHAEVPVIGYVFSEAWAKRNRPALDGFLSASGKARAILAESDAEWQRLMPLTGAKSQAELERLKALYRAGIPRQWGEAERRAAAQLFTVLARIGGQELVGAAGTLAEGTFWPVTGA